MARYASRDGKTTDAITVWVIEDDSEFRETLSFLLDNTSGMKCGGAHSDVETALDWVNSYQRQSRPWPRPDVLLLDINLPGLSGIEGLGRIKAKLPDTRIVMLTIRDDANTIVSAFQQGASGYLLKNAGVDRIIAAVREAHSGGMLMPAPVARQVLDIFRQQTPDHDYGLTDREKEVLNEMVSGRTQKEIAERLFVSPNTINTHVQHIYDKLHVHSGTEAVAKAVRERLVDDVGP
jgi:DNA-binding NarL/FixJ family response regulator